MRPLIWPSLLRGSILSQAFKSSYGSFSASIQAGITSFQPSLPRAFTSSTMYIPVGMDPAARHIYFLNTLENYDKWGWVFYRCAYNNDEEWNDFKRMVTTEMHTDIVVGDTLDVYQSVSDSLALTFFEDKDKFNGAPRAQLRTHFQRWAVDAFPAENPRAKQNFDLDLIPARYRYFFQIDEESLRSIIDSPKNVLERRWDYIQFCGWLVETNE